MDQVYFNKTLLKICNPLPGSTPEPVTYTLTVKKKYEGKNIIDFFTEAVPRSDRDVWINKINIGNLTVNQVTIHPDYIVKAGDITCHSSDPKTEPPVSTDIKLLYDDKDIMVINKPSPLPMHASGRFVRNTLIHMLQLAFPKEDLKVIHRIDANTTGVVILAKNKEAANAIRQQFENKTVEKQYVALVEGVIKKDLLTHNVSIGKEVLIGGSRKIDVQGKDASTDIKVLERRIHKNETLLSIVPHTGRTNQIRLHLANINHPIVGDIGHKNPDYYKNNPFTYPDDSLFLHAYQLKIKHPTTNNVILFEAPIPDKFYA